MNFSGQELQDLADCLDDGLDQIGLDQDTKARYLVLRGMVAHELAVMAQLARPARHEPHIGIPSQAGRCV